MDNLPVVYAERETSLKLFKRLVARFFFIIGNLWLNVITGNFCKSKLCFFKGHYAGIQNISAVACSFASILFFFNIPAMGAWFHITVANMFILLFLVIVTPKLKRHYILFIVCLLSTAFPSSGPKQAIVETSSAVLEMIKYEIDDYLNPKPIYQICDTKVGSCFEVSAIEYEQVLTEVFAENEKQNQSNEPEFSYWNYYHKLYSKKSNI
jgi:hypothetical protein